MYAINKYRKEKLFGKKENLSKEKRIHEKYLKIYSRSHRTEKENGIVHKWCFCCFQASLIALPVDPVIQKTILVALPPFMDNPTQMGKKYFSCFYRK